MSQMILACQNFVRQCRYGHRRAKHAEFNGLDEPDLCR